MKLFILQKKIKEGLSITERACPKSPILSILNNVLISAQKNFLTLITTDLEIAVKWWALAKTEIEGNLAVPLSLISNFLSLLPNKQVSVQKKEKSLSIECENYKIQINGLPVEDFPIIPEVSKENFVEVEAAPFCRGIEQVVDIASVSYARPEISGIYFVFQNETVKMAATDSFRLGEKTLLLKEGAFSTSQGKEIAFIAPQKTCKEIINIFGQREGIIKIYFSPNQILLEGQMLETPHPEVQLISRLIDGDYPAYQEIIPKKFETQVILPRTELLNHLRMASLFGEKANEVKLKVSPQKAKIEFFSQHPDFGEHLSFLPGKIKGAPLEVSFNHRFLISGLTNIKSSEVIFELQKEEGPAVLRPVGDPSYLYVVMPIKAS